MGSNEAKSERTDAVQACYDARTADECRAAPERIRPYVDFAEGEDPDGEAWGASEQASMMLSALSQPAEGWSRPNRP